MAAASGFWLQILGIAITLAGSLDALNRALGILDKCRKVFDQLLAWLRTILASRCGDKTVSPLPARPELIGGTPRVKVTSDDPAKRLENVEDALEDLKAGIRPTINDAIESHQAGRDDLNRRFEVRDIAMTVGGATISAIGFVIEHLSLFQR